MSTDRHSVDLLILTSPARLMQVLLSLRDDSGDVRTSREEIACRCRISVRTVERLFVKLESGGILRRFRGGCRVLSDNLSDIHVGHPCRTSVSDIRVGHAKAPTENKEFPPTEKSAHKEERARLGVGVGIKRNNKTPSPPTPLSLEPLLAELRSHDPTIERYVAARIFSDLREKSPDISPDEAFAILKTKARSARGSRSVIAVVRSWAKDYFSDGDLADYRIGQEKFQFEASAQERKREDERLRRQQDIQNLEPALSELGARRLNEFAAKAEAEEKAMDLRVKTTAWVKNWFDSHPDKGALDFGEVPPEMMPIVRVEGRSKNYWLHLSTSLDMQVSAERSAGS